MYTHNEIFLLEKFYMYLYMFERDDACFNVEVRGQLQESALPATT